MSAGDDRAGGRPVAGVLEARNRNRDAGPQQIARSDPGPVDNGVELAPSGWLVEVRLTIDEGPGFRFFAVGTPSPDQAEEAILRFPGIFRDDVRIALRQLSDEEIARLALRGHGVRPYRIVRRR